MHRSKIAVVSFLLLLGGILISACAYAAEESVELKQEGTQINVLIGGKPFTTYYFKPDVAKPFFMPLRTVITRGFPSGNTIPPEHLHDRSLEPHQRPMYFGHGNIDGIDFWGEAVFPKYSEDSVFGHADLVKVEEIKSGPTSGSLRAVFHLVGPKGRNIADMTQAYVFRGDETTRMIDCEITITANQGAPVTMGDTKEGTFAIRVVDELHSPPGHMVNSNGGVGEKEIWGKPANWVDYYGKVGSEDVGVAIFDSPQNFRHPTTWHARGYGLFSVNPFGLRDFTRDPKQDGSWTIPIGKSLTLRYRVLIHHGDYKQAHVAEAYQEYAGEQ
jgi:hypothetical protein